MKLKNMWPIKHIKWYLQRKKDRDEYKYAIKSKTFQPPPYTRPERKVEVLSKAEKGRKALDELVTKAEEWARIYLGYAEDDGWIGCGFHAGDLRDSIREWMLPYAGRLYKTEHITLEELSDFYEDLHSIIDKVKMTIEKMEEIIKNES